MLNNITIMGRLVRDPELRYTANQVAVTSFTLACERDIGKETDFIDCVVWRNTAEFVKNHFNKGSMAIVEGRLQIREWKDKDGKKRYSPEVKAERVYFGEKKQKTDSAFVELENDEVDGELPF